MKELENPMMGLFVGTMFTALIQSSAASIGVIIVLSQQGLITLEAGIPIIFGANIGTCITAGLASIGTSRDAKRVALAHVLFKIAGVILFIFWIPSFASLVQTLAEQFGSGPARQIANAHTIFNVSIGVIFLPFTAYFAKLILWLFPEKDEGKDFRMATWHLDEASISTPALAIDLARSEISRMAKILGRMLRAIIIPYMSDEKLIKKEGLTAEETALLIKEIPKQDEIFPDLTLLQGISMREEKIDLLDEKINEYLVQIARKELSEDQTNEVYGMMSISNDLESIGDLIHRNMVPLIAKKQKLSVDFCEEGKEELMIYHQKVCKQISLLKEAFAEINLEKAQEIMAGERKYLDLESQYRVKHLERLRHDRKESVETHEVHMELMDLMKQIIVYSSNIAKTFLVKCKTS
jgi:phosphate:Na+ symporter